MPRLSLKAKNAETLKKIQTALEETIIIKRQERMTYGRWDFMVFGPVNKKETVVRVGFAEHATIQRAPLYIATLAESGLRERGGVPIKEFITEDIPDEYEGLEVYHIDPLRPLTITEKNSFTGGGRKTNSICKQYENENVAIIQSPQDSDWSISVMKYLHECDQNFPDLVLETFFRKGREQNSESLRSSSRPRRLLN